MSVMYPQPYAFVIHHMGMQPLNVKFLLHQAFLKPCLLYHVGCFERQIEGSPEERKDYGSRKHLI